MQLKVIPKVRHGSANQVLWRSFIEEREEFNLSLQDAVKNYNINTNFGDFQVADYIEIP